MGSGHSGLVIAPSEDTVLGSHEIEAECPKEYSRGLSLSTGTRLGSHAAFSSKGLP